MDNPRDYREFENPLFQEGRENYLGVRRKRGWLSMGPRCFAFPGKHSTAIAFPRDFDGAARDNKVALLLSFVTPPCESFELRSREKHFLSYADRFELTFDYQVIDSADAHLQFVRCALAAE